MTETEIDKAHADMSANPEDDAARLRFYERIADSELYLLLVGEPDGDQVSPELFDVKDQKFALVFDREERLSSFVGRAAPYAGLPGRGLIQMLDGQNVGLALNLEVAPSAMLIPPNAVDWLAEILRNAPEETQGTLSELRSPGTLPEEVVTGLDRKLAIAAGLASHAYLAGAVYKEGGVGHILAFVDARDEAEKALAHAAGEALTFSGIEAGTIDVMFVSSGDEVADILQRVGLRFDLPVPEQPSIPGAPGMDPENPPKLT